MDGKEMCTTLSDDVVERIFAKLPFPFIFKARCLSKSWLARFFSISSEDDEGKKQCLATSFQKQVGECSNNWGTFCPVIVSKENSFAYDQSSQSWRRMPSLSFLPDHLLPSPKLQIEGALLYFYVPLASTRFDGHDTEIYVANILTRSWRHLPPCPETDRGVLSLKLVTDTFSETYKVILFCQEYKWQAADPYFLQIYDSKSDSWSCKRLGNARPDFRTSSTYLNGVLYTLAVTKHPMYWAFTVVGNTPPILWAFNVEENTLEQLEVPYSYDLSPLDSQNLVVCKDDLMMVGEDVVSYHDYLEHYGTGRSYFQVFKVDLGSLRLVHLARGPPDALNMSLSHNSVSPVGDGDYIFLGVEEHTSRMLAYNVVKDEWSSHPVPTIASGEHKYEWIGSAFKPGLSPFATV